MIPSGSWIPRALSRQAAQAHTTPDQLTRPFQPPESFNFRPSDPTPRLRTPQKSTNQAILPAAMLQSERLVACRTW